MQYFNALNINNYQLLYKIQMLVDQLFNEDANILTFNYAPLNYVVLV